METIRECYQRQCCVMNDGSGVINFCLGGHEEVDVVIIGILLIISCQRLCIESSRECLKIKTILISTLRLQLNIQGGRIFNWININWMYSFDVIY